MIYRDSDLLIAALAKKAKGGGESTGSTDVSRIYHGTSDTTFVLPSNEFHVWGEIPTLNITLQQGSESNANIYWFAFDSGDTATVLTLPDTVNTDIVVESNTHYECSIVDNYMTFSEWAVSE